MDGWHDNSFSLPMMVRVYVEMKAKEQAPLGHQPSL
jgi:hypothetical protein